MANPTFAKAIACFLARALVAAALDEEGCNQESCHTKGPALLQGVTSVQTSLLPGDAPTERTLEDKSIAKLSKRGHPEHREDPKVESPLLAELGSNVSVEFSCSDQYGQCSGFQQFCAHSSPNTWVKNNCQRTCNCCDNPRHLSFCSEHASLCDPNNPNTWIKENCCLTCSLWHAEATVQQAPLASQTSSTRRRGTNFVEDIKRCSERQDSRDVCENGDRCCNWYYNHAEGWMCILQHQDTLDGSRGELACLNGQTGRR